MKLMLCISIHMFGTKVRTMASKSFGVLGGAVRKFGSLAHTAVRTAGNVANAVGSAYHTIDNITGRALDRTLRTVPGVGTALTGAGAALNFYNSHVDPRRVALAGAVDKLGNHLSSIKI
jgi:hypothetical protein